MNIEQEAAAATPPETITQCQLPIALPSQPANIIHPLSAIAKAVLDLPGDTSAISDPRTTTALARLLESSEVLWRASSDRYVVKFNAGIIVKCVDNNADFTEYTSIQYLETHKPQIPAPRPHGLIVSGNLAYIFMSLIPGSTLAEVWHNLDGSKKKMLSDEINSIFLDLRQLKLPEGTPLGGVGGEGCKDVRRNTKRCNRPLYTGGQFWEFQYSEAHCRSKIFLQLLRDLTRPLQSSKCVFTHGDVHPLNIMVERSNSGEYHISGLVDWERSGFYPEDFECTKITNCLATDETNDWYLYLPACISPAAHVSRWLSDSRWDKFVA